MNVQMTTRVPEKIRQEAEIVFAENGLDSASALRMFVTKVANERRIPLRIDEKVDDTSDNNYVKRMHKLVARRRGKVPEVRFDKNTRGGVTGPADYPRELREAWTL